MIAKSARNGVSRRMMRCYITLIVLILGLIVGLIIGFVEEARAFRVVGSGAGSCGTWLEDRRTPKSEIAHMDYSGVLGFLADTAYEGAQKNPLNGMDSAGISAWIDNYCRANPTQNISDAAAAFSEAHPR